MITVAHILFGAAIGTVVKNVPLAIILAFLSHYFLDFIPHLDYPIKNIQGKQWRKITPDIFRIVLDFLLGLLLIMLFSNNKPIIYICGFVAALPDLFTVLYYIFPNKILTAHYKLHEKIHFLKQVKISIFWRITTQVLVVLLSIVLLRQA